MLASLIETCKLHGVNPEAWLADVLTKLVNGWPNRRLAELTPWAWQAQNRRSRSRVIGTASAETKPKPSSKRQNGAPGASLTV